MLNITDNIVHCENELADLKAPKHNMLSLWHISARNLLLTLLAVFIVFLFLPWTQNVRGDGKLTTLRPEQRPQTIHATISGRIERWYVTEGQRIHQGDTIVFLSEVKADYFDPRLVERVADQVSAKERAIQSYSGKFRALESQIAALQREMENKIQQIRNKIRQAELKIESDQAALEQARVGIQIARRQFEGTKILYERGLKSLTEFEEKKGKLQEGEAKLVSAETRLASGRNDLEIYQTELQLTRNEYENKIAKAESDKFSALSDRYDTEATVSKLQIDRANYDRRRQFYYILAPQDGYIVKAIQPGIGEIIKDGEPVVSILPADYQLAVEMYVRPMDLPLISAGSKVRFLFDGWPAFFFSGWPGISLGTFGGSVAVIDRNISSNGKYRLLVAPDPTQTPWPAALQIGGGAKGIALLHEVPLWYELWRTLNGFPPDLYQENNTPEEKKGNSFMPKMPVKNAK
jgi:adhesin transport system membrane fusion protein